MYPITAAQARAEAVRNAADMIGHAIVALVHKLRPPPPGLAL
jgi:hypothetical protein